MIEEGREGEAVARGAEAGDLSQADRGEEGCLSELLSGVDVAEVGLHHREVDGGDGVANGYRGVGVGAWIDDDAVCPRLPFVELVVWLPLSCSERSPPRDPARPAGPCPGLSRPGSWCRRPRSPGCRGG